MSKHRRAFSSKGLEIRSADLVGDHGVVSLSDREPKEEVLYLLTLAVSMAGSKGSDLFYTRIATPEALKAKAPEAPTVMSSRTTMVVSAFDWLMIDDHLKKILKDCAAQTWIEAVERLIRFFSWEYEDAHHPSRDHVVIPSKRLKIRSADLVGDYGPVVLRGQKANEEVYYLLTLTIGMAGEESTNRFSMRIATPEALQARAPKTPTVMSSRALMIVSAFDWRTIDERLKEILKECEAATWSDATQRLLRIFSWEHEGS